jgi:hypothetical protein
MLTSASPTLKRRGQMPPAHKATMLAGSLVFALLSAGPALAQSAAEAELQKLAEGM